MIACAIAAIQYGRGLKRAYWATNPIVAKSLCDQLQAVNRRISDALTLDQSEAFVAPLAQQQFSRPPGQSTSSLSVEAGVSSIPELPA
jgi:hypothetical protein